jgi:hypothetical protein
MPRLRIWRFVSSQCVSLFYVIDTGSIRPRARILGGPRWRLPIYPSLLAQTLAMPSTIILFMPQDNNIVKICVVVNQDEDILVE